MTTPADDMRWPTLRHKLGNPHFLWFAHSLGWWVIMREDWVGCWLWVQMGRLAFRTGRGEYDANAR
jgi:hypothetical protein